MGSPSEGRLVGGVALEPGRYVRIVPAYQSTGARWGLSELVSLLEKAARRMAREYPGTVLNVGDLSRRGGGELDRHRSHESGRDADVAFFVRSAAGKLLAPEKFVSFDGNGTAAAWPGAYFDDARNWALIAALLDDPSSRITHIFISAPLRARLLRQAEHVAASRELRDRAALVLMQPHGTLPHDDHFHVRIGCPASQNGECVELATVYRPKGRGVWVARGRSRFGRGVTPEDSPDAPAAPAAEAPPSKEVPTIPASPSRRALPSAEAPSHVKSGTGSGEPLRFIPASLTVRFAPGETSADVCEGSDDGSRASSRP
jgi:penicillin-insensitive murein endopeptidase